MRGEKWVARLSPGLLFAMVAIAFLAGCSQETAAGDWVVVERVVDGDTFIIAGGERVRMIGVDTPETVKPGTAPQPYGKEASQYTETMLSGKKVRLEFDVAERDKYGRLLAYVYLEDGTFVNEKLVSEGYARVMTVPPNVKYAERFLAAERKARQERRGLWGLGDEGSVKEAEAVEEHPASEEEPRQGLIKGNINSKGEKIYHVPGGRYYDVTEPEVWFETEEEAEAAGFRRSKY